MQRLITLGVVVLCVLFAPAATAANVEGIYDDSFSNTGRKLIDVSPSASDKGRVLRIQTGGKLLLGGTCGSLNTFCATRLDPSGTIDLGFGPDGTGTISFDRFFAQGFPTGDTLADMLSLGDGRILFLGSNLAMLTADGKALDGSVGGGNGYIYSSNVQSNYAMAEQADHKILVAGYALRSDASGNFDMYVQRFLPNLTPDTDFGTGGGQRIVFNLGGSVSLATSLALQSNGNIVVAGYATFTFGPGKLVGIARLLPTGQPDPAFGGGGPVYQSFNPENVAYSVRIDQKGRIVYGGYTATDTTFSTRKCLINRLLANGSQDFSFNGNQAQQFTVLVNTTNAPCELFDVAPQPDGTVLAVGSVVDVYFTAVRLTPSGNFDTTFGVGGVSVGAFDPAATSSVVRSGATAIGNGLLIAGAYNGPSDTRFGIAQLTLTVRVFANGFEN